MPITGYKFYGRRIRPYFYSPGKKSHTILGMTLFSLIIFGAFAIRPSLFTILRLQQEVKRAREAKTLLDQKIDDLSQAQINYQLASEDLKLVDKALPEDAAVPEILEDLALVAGRSNVTLNKAEFGPAPFCNGKRCGVPLTVTIAGDLTNVEEFVAALEGGIRQTDVQRVRINRGGEELKTLIAEIELVTYFFERSEKMQGS